MIYCGHAASSFQHIWQSLLLVCILIAIHRLFLYQDRTRLESRFVWNLIIKASKHEQVLIGQIHSGAERAERLLDLGLCHGPEVICDVVFADQVGKPADHFYLLAHS